MPPLSHNAIAKRESDFLEVMGQLDWIDKIEIIFMAHMLLARTRMRARITYILFCLAASSLVLVPVLMR